MESNRPKKIKLILANVFGMFLVINLRLFEVLMTSFWYKIINRISSVVLKRYHTENMVWWIVLYNMYDCVLVLDLKV